VIKSEEIRVLRTRRSDWERGKTNEKARLGMTVVLSRLVGLSVKGHPKGHGVRITAVRAKSREGGTSGAHIKDKWAFGLGKSPLAVAWCSVEKKRAGRGNERKQRVLREVWGGVKTPKKGL